ncbi:MAG: formate dehydrogenase major subunit [Solirubrobacteraceae bacterium]|nr:formate dehydrogenase major subunit [Solirubrobacteraceae bacterium]
MSLRARLTPPVLRQLRSDPLGLGRAARSARSERLTPRIATADRVAKSVCPYCAVGCGQRVYVKDERVIQIEGDPDSPISRGRLCPKGSASEQLVNSPRRVTTVRYRRPGATEWEDLSLEQATEMIADRLITTREATWEDTNADGEPLKRTLGMHFLGGATLDSEENYLIKKFFTAAGAVSVENQARI